MKQNVELLIVVALAAFAGLVLWGHLKQADSAAVSGTSPAASLLGMVKNLFPSVGARVATAGNIEAGTVAPNAAIMPGGPLYVPPLPSLMQGFSVDAPGSGV